MFEIFCKRFFSALQKDAEFKLGRGHACVTAIARAAQSGEKVDVEAAQEQLALLPEEVSHGLMEAAHKTLREDPAALLDMWQAKGNSTRPN